MRDAGSRHAVLFELIRQENLVEARVVGNGQSNAETENMKHFLERAILSLRPYK